MSLSEAQKKMDKTQLLIMVRKPYEASYNTKAKAYLTRHNLINLFVKYNDKAVLYHRLRNGGATIEMQDIVHKQSDALTYHSFPLSSYMLGDEFDKKKNYNKFLKVNHNGETTFVDLPAGGSGGGSSGSSVTTFLELNDTPGSYEAGKVLAVNSSGNALEFKDLKPKLTLSDEQVKKLTKEQTDPLIQSYQEAMAQGIMHSVGQINNEAKQSILQQVSTPANVTEIKNSVAQSWKDNLKDELKAELSANITQELATAVLAKMAKEGNNVVYTPTINMANVKLIKDGAEVNVSLEQGADGKLVGKNIDINGAFTIEISKA